MTADEKIYTCLCVLFAVLIVTGNLIYQKFVSLPILSLELSVGAILYPLTFLLTDLIAEFYGKEKAGFCVKLAIVMNVIIAIAIMLMDSLNATSWSKVDNEVFHIVFGKYSVNFIASIIACYIAQLIDIKLYLWIRKITDGNFLWLRNNGSTVISLLIDTSIVVSILCVFNVLPIERMLAIIISSYSFKFLFTVCSTPLFYFGVWVIKRLL
ncbi:MAG TPA: hypothetical protein DEQ74_01060 [Wolbachia sp.]|jgi:uncharacterized integral membrane protein (TIGR00697 family)|uniref:queuosine precursor transporter n=1 Tax=Wolbachia endosymbiont of Pentalonia nigronervosa TaxID=1301914 RepID=UPI000EDA0CF4|nr:queuosine precursor transporter [Wolbachia endosymbiont of Pentalonia nigronervosa]MBD0390918.1 queuosine precursor transporter [Wolbachia endosymbiont of Pentalonia nigronervosa]HCE59411.1 hypothetical protein [Wolbachia sp.]